MSQKYYLAVIQQPQRARRSFKNSLSDRRMINPTPVIQLQGILPEGLILPPNFEILYIVRS